MREGRGRYNIKTVGKNIGIWIKNRPEIAPFPF